MKRLLTILITAFVVAALPVPAWAEPPKCAVCSMKVDDAHNVHFKYLLDGKDDVHLGSLACAQKYWAAHKDQKMTFQGKDFVQGKYSAAEKGFFLVGSKLNVGTGMDKGGAVFFSDGAMAERAQKANGGKIVPLSEALAIVKR